MQQYQTEDRMKVIAIAGAALIILGVGIALWVVSLVYDIINDPEDIPLVARILADVGSGDEIFSFEETDDGFTLFGSDTTRGIVLLGFLAFLFGALGGIVNALITGGVRLIIGDKDWKLKTGKKGTS
jgi:hypothetical protein